MPNLSELAGLFGFTEEALGRLMALRALQQAAVAPKAAPAPAAAPVSDSKRTIQTNIRDAINKLDLAQTAWLMKKHEKSMNLWLQSYAAMKRALQAIHEDRRKGIEHADIMPRIEREMTRLVNFSRAAK